MPVDAAELLLHSAASRPIADTGTSGGALNDESRPELTQFSASAVAAVVSDGADTRDVTVTGRLANGVIDTEDLTLTGTTEVVGATTFERILSVVADAPSATRTITVRQGAGGTTRATIGLNETTRHILFVASASDPTNPTVRYEKLFWLNTDAVLALLDAEVELVTDADDLFEIALADAKDDTESVANRLTAPIAASAFVDDGVAIVVPTDMLDALEAIGVWIKQTLPAAEAAGKGTLTVSLAGAST